MHKLIRITTVPISLKVLLRGQHRFMQENGFEVIGVSSPGRELDDVHLEEGIRIETVEMTRVISPLKDLKSLWRFYKLCKKERPLMVHSHTPKAGIIGMLGAKLAGVPIRLHTVAGMPLMESAGLKRKILNFVERFTYACATKVYPNSRGLYDFILKEGFTSPQKLHVIGTGSSNGIDTSFYAKEQVAADQLQRLRSELNISEDDFVFIFVGRLVTDKGINELIEAFSAVKSASPRSIKLLLVGSLESELDPLAPKTLEIMAQDKDIIAVGFQKDVRPYLALAHCLAFPSYREGFPNVVMQAGAMELPCIVSDINGCNEIVEHGQNGVIVPPKDAGALAHAMAAMVQHPELCAQYKQKSRQMIQSRYEQVVVWSALLQEYRQLISLKGQ